MACGGTLTPSESGLTLSKSTTGSQFLIEVEMSAGTGAFGIISGSCDMRRTTNISNTFTAPSSGTVKLRVASANYYGTVTTSADCEYTVQPSQCTRCIAGKYYATAGASQCTDCMAGKYSPTADSQQGRTFLFGDYDSGRVVGCDDPEMIIGTHAFELSMTITPTAQGYGMLASHDRSCDGNFQFRLEIYQSMKVSLQCEGIRVVGGVTDGDPIGVRSELCSAALPLGQPSRVGVRRESDGRFKLLVNDALVSEHRSGPPADLRIGTISDRAFRIGSRFPPTGSEQYKPFASTIRQAVLRILLLSLLLLSLLLLSLLPLPAV
jgi:hypothetical protein